MHNASLLDVTANDAVRLNSTRTRNVDNRELSTSRLDFYHKQIKKTRRKLSNGWYVKFIVKHICRRDTLIPPALGSMVQAW